MAFGGKLLLFFNTGAVRSSLVKKNIALSFIFKGISISIGLLLVPMTLNYLNQTEYGIWLTLYSILSWISFFDIGLGNGLRNKFAEARAKQDLGLAKIYVSTTFALLASIIGAVFLVFLFINPFLNWASILNTDPSLAKELSLTVLIVFVFFCLQFIFKLINMLLLADQKSAISDLINLCGTFLSLICIFILTKTAKGSLLFVGVVFSAMPVLVLITAYFIVFRGIYKNFRPSIKCVNFKYSKDLMGLGVQFFVIQIAGIIVFTTSNLIISQLFGPAQVTPYNIAFKYFSILTMSFSIILSPFWSAYTEAYYKNDFGWIRRVKKRLVQVWFIFCAITIIMVFCADFVYKFWVGPKIQVPFLLTLFVAFSTILTNWNNIFANFINGIGKIRLQLYSSIFVGIINIPLAIFLGKLLGIAGIVLSTCITILFGSIWAPIQYSKIVNGRAKGIWFK